MSQTSRHQARMGLCNTHAGLSWLTMSTFVNQRKDRSASWNANRNWFLKFLMLFFVFVMFYRTAHASLAPRLGLLISVFVWILSLLDLSGG